MTAGRARVAARLVAALLAATAVPVPSHAGEDLESLRRTGELGAQRRHAWHVLAAVARDAAADPAFGRWYGENEVFAPAAGLQVPLGLRGFAHASAGAGAAAAVRARDAADAPVITYSFYNAAAYRHVRDHDLHRRAALQRLQHDAPEASAPRAAVPPFPTDAVVVKTAWWPVARHGLTALPVWDPDLNPPHPRGNGHLGWRRVVAIDVDADERSGAVVSVDFVGRPVAGARRVRLDALHRVEVDASLATRIMRDRDARKAVLIALGRPLAPGDHLVLVAVNLATREIDDWVWVAAWWHDQPERGPFAADRPDELRAEWRNYLLQVAFDAELPRGADGGAHVCFNPWFEGRFPDGGRGGGVVSNCMACHARASYPPVPFLPVTRGNGDVARDAAYARDRVETSLLWSIALHAAP